MRASVLVLFSLFLVSSAKAQQTDAAATVQRLLSAHGTVPWTHDINDPTQQWRCTNGHVGHPGRGGGGDDTGDNQCHWVTIPHWHPATQPVTLSASNIQIISVGDVVFDSTVKSSLPNEVSASGAVWQNCSKTVPVSNSETLAIAFQRSSSVAVNKSFTHTSGHQIQFQWKPLESLQLTGQISVTDATTSGTTDTNSYQQTVTRTHQASAQLSPQKALAVVIRTWPVKYTATFHTTGTVDADLSPNDQFKRLSQVLPEDQRTFPINGSVVFEDAADAQVVSHDLPYDPSICGGSDKLVKKQLNPKLASKALLRLLETQLTKVRAEDAKN